MLYSHLIPCNIQWIIVQFQNFVYISELQTHIREAGSRCLIYSLQMTFLQHHREHQIIDTNLQSLFCDVSYIYLFHMI